MSWAAVTMHLRHHRALLTFAVAALTVLAMSGAWLCHTLDAHPGDRTHLGYAAAERPLATTVVTTVDGHSTAQLAVRRGDCAGPDAAAPVAARLPTAGGFHGPAATPPISAGAAAAARSSPTPAGIRTLHNGRPPDRLLLCVFQI